MKDCSKCVYCTDVEQTQFFQRVYFCSFLEGWTDKTTICPCEAEFDTIHKSEEED